MLLFKIAAGMLATIIIASTFSHMPVAKAAGVTIIDSVGMLGSGGYRIVGELRNDVGSTIGNVIVSASLLDSSGSSVASVSGNPFIKTLRPGEKSAFALSLADTGIGSRVASYKLDVTWSNAVDKPSTLKVIAGNGYYDSAGAYHLVGEVSNTGLVTARSVAVSAAFYDKDGKIAGADSVFTVPAQLAAGSTAPFHFIYDRASQNLIASSSVNVQSDEFSSIMDLQPSAQESSPAQKTPAVAINLDMQSYHFADTVHVSGNVSSLVAGESLVTIELLYPDGSLLNSLQVPLIKNLYFASFDILAGSEFDGKTFAVKATYAGGSATSSLKYLGTGTPPSSPEKQDLKKQYNTRLYMSASLNGQKVLIMSLKNPKGSDAVVYGMNIKIDKGSIKSATGTTGWKAKIDGNTVKFTTSSKPVMAGKPGNFKIRVSDAVHAVSWSAIDKGGKIIDSNSAAVKARK